jgi:uncharacterized protein YbjQ (UPF0145 family)
LVLATVSGTSFARDDINDYSIEEAMSIPKISNAIGGGVKFFYADQEHPKVIKSLGQYQSSNKTNAFGKTDKEACQWVFASTLKTLRKRALNEGGNAVINIRSVYKNNPTSSTTTFQCGSGALIAGVALVGDVVKLEEK